MTTITVTSGAQFVSVMKKVKGGETILLAPGNYGDVALGNLKPTSQITVRSADPDNDAVFDSLKLTRVSNVLFEDIDVHHVLNPGEQDFVSAITVNGSTDITFVGIDASGSLNGNANDDGNGLFVQGSSRITVLDSTFQEFNNAAVFGKSSDVIFAGNSIRDAREGVNIAQIDGGLFERNYITGIRPDEIKRDHSDAFQVQAGGTNGVSNDLVFNANVIMGDNNQGIFIGNEKYALGGRHTNIVVTNNYIEGNLRNAIGLGGIDNVVVQNNTIRDADGPGIPPGITTSNLTNGIISYNVVPIIDPRRGAAFASTNLVIENNIDIWDTTQKRGINDAQLFSAPVGTGDIDFSALGVRAGSAADSLGAGFRPVDGIGNLSDSTATLLAAYIPQLDGNFAAAFPA